MNESEIKQRFSIKKLSIGVVSVCVGICFVFLVFLHRQRKYL
ncbi:YSIRK-type signal peptide-containing protein [Enterococcus mundtii]